MHALWLLLCMLSIRGPLVVLGTSVSFRSDGALLAEHPPLRAEQPEVRLVMPQGDWNVSQGSFMMNVTIVDAHETDKAMQSLSDLDIKDRNKSGQVNVVSSWILFHMPGNHTDSLQRPTLPLLVGGLRDAVADALEVCRSSVGIVDMRAINIDVIDKVDSGSLLQSGEDSSKQNSSREATQGEAAQGEAATLMEHAANLMRRMRHDDDEKSHVNVTQIKAVYEVRLFPEMRTNDAEVGRRVDKFQIYSKFADLNRLLTRSLSQVDEHSMEGVMLDDVGYASQHQLWRPPLTADELKDCVEEVSLHDARQLHQFIVAISLIMVALITCAGSTVFTIKHASSVPSRMNPLVSTSPQ